jgi:hypothetical protein
MIPETIFKAVAYGQYYNRGAIMTKGEWTYVLHHESGNVACIKSRIVSKENKNTYTDLHGVITEYLDCRLSDVPASVESDWHTWDEY